MTSTNPLDQALALHRAGQIAEAISIYRALLDQNPEEADLHHLLALALASTAPLAAWTAFRRALALAPAAGLYLHNAARLAEGADKAGLERALSRALAVDPSHSAPHHQLGALDARAGRPDRAERRFHRSIALDPTLSPALFNHASIAADAMRVDLARQRYARLLAVDPRHQEGLGNLGMLLFRCSRWREAEAIFAQLARCAPERFDALTALGATRAELGDIFGAIACIRSALVLEPRSADNWQTLAGTLFKDPAADEATFRAAQRAVWLAPAMTGSHVIRSLVLLRQGRVREAIAARRAVFAYAPDDAQAHYEFLPFLHLDPDLDPASQLAIRRDVHRRFSDPLTRAAVPHMNDRDPERRLKLGYVDNRLLCRSTHSTNLLPMIEAHDPQQVSLCFYTNLPEAMADDMTRRYRAMATGLHHTAGLSDEEVALLVQADEIDILVDVSGHLTGVRAGVFARKPAPIQVTMLQVGSSGLGTMDYAVADPVLLPADRPSFFTARGIAVTRLDFRAWTDGYAAHLATFDEIDVALDCFPYPGMTTSIEALLMGVPVVTLTGDRFVARIGETILRTVGHPEWVARNTDDYIAIASALAGDPGRRATLRNQLRGELLSSPFGDPRSFTRGLEAAFRDAWRRWCRERPGKMA